MEEINIKKWKEFTISELFKIEKAKNITIEVAQEYIGNEIPYITRTEYDNGANFFVMRTDKFQLEKGNCITIGGEGANIYYQDSDFISGNNINKLYAEHLNSDNALFIVSILKLEKYRYSYNRAFNRKCIEMTKIKLPIDEEGKPNWNYMARYIRTLREREREFSTFWKIYSQQKYKLNYYFWLKMVQNEGNFYFYKI